MKAKDSTSDLCTSCDLSDYCDPVNDAKAIVGNNYNVIECSEYIPEEENIINREL